VGTGRVTTADDGGIAGQPDTRYNYALIARMGFVPGALPSAGTTSCKPLVVRIAICDLSSG
jgi:hypothetical protein